MPSFRLAAALLAAAGLAELFSLLSLPDDMARSPGRHDLAVPAAGTLATRGEPPMERDDAAERLRSPLAPGADPARGERLYAIYCTVCHGASGKGDGPVGGKLGMKLLPLTDDAVAGQPDGYLYATIRNGGFLMPAYAEALSPEERWAVVGHLRALQKR